VDAAFPRRLTTTPITIRPQASILDMKLGIPKPANVTIADRIHQEVTLAIILWMTQRLPGFNILLHLTFPTVITSGRWCHEQIKRHFEERTITEIDPVKTRSYIDFRLLVSPRPA